MTQHELHTVEPTDEERRIFSWRYAQLRLLGFEIGEARLLAESDADLELVRRLVGSGCPTELAIRIAL